MHGGPGTLIGASQLAQALPALAIAKDRRTVQLELCIFRTAIHRQREETYVVDRLFLQPAGAAMRWIVRFLAGMHDGRLNAYMTCVLAFFLLVLFL
ncbi:MAG: hypothetical protein WBD06_22195 [Acidobacteriaceae bacterium]